ncbi:uncharacterized protein EDB91DRAFT_1081844 [Suillus paluster]|uniref:uncharacterized protein n=1 Tax=Suillus paluster TaxID=48578 RepID=UPI001B874722|nr:uncharacterized protein EDB91DRAFT_1081844 [Suillus paluster]KAG1740746.1 hypothetical protein EDB91DRAFT_1081844 [Suillus paluster]
MVASPSRSLGFVWRETEQPEVLWNPKDNILWQGLWTIQGTLEDDAVWQWVVKEVVSTDKMCAEVLKKAGYMWIAHKSKAGKQSTNKTKVSMDQGKEEKKSIEQHSHNSGSSITCGPDFLYPAEGLSAISNAWGKDRQGPMHMDQDGDGSSESSGGRGASMPAANEAASAGASAADRSTDSCPPAPSASTGPTAQIDDARHPPRSTNTPPPTETLPSMGSSHLFGSINTPPPSEAPVGVGSTAASDLTIQQPVSPLYILIYQGVSKYVKHEQSLHEYATNLRSNFPASNYEAAIARYEEKLAARSLQPFNAREFQLHVTHFINQLSITAAMLAADEQNKGLL